MTDKIIAYRVVDLEGYRWYFDTQEEMDDCIENAEVFVQSIYKLEGVEL